MMENGKSQSQPDFALKGKRRRQTVSLAPLIDVTFILLIFFMLVTEFDRFLPLSLSLGEAEPLAALLPASKGAGKKQEIRLIIHGDGRLMFAGQESFPLEDLAARLKTRFLSLDPRAFSRGHEKKPDLLIAPKTDVSLQRLIDVLRAVQQQSAFAVKIVIPDNSGGQ